MAARDLGARFDRLSQKLDALTRALTKQARGGAPAGIVGAGPGGIAGRQRVGGAAARGIAGGIIGGGVAGGGAGGLAGAGLAGGLPGLLAQSAVTAAKATLPFIESALVNQRGGGTIAGGLATQAVSSLADIPVLGELTGAAPVQRIQQGALGDINQLTNQIARFGGADALSPRVRGFLADRLVEQNRNIEEDRRRNLAAIGDRAKDAAKGQGDAIERLISAIEGLAGKMDDANNKGGGESGGRYN